MLELIVAAFKFIFRFDNWVIGSHFLDTLGDDQRERQHNRQWARGFLEEKRLERQQMSENRAARASSLVKPAFELGRPGSRRNA